jgi:hypothetical protein
MLATAFAVALQGEREARPTLRYPTDEGSERLEPELAVYGAGFVACLCSVRDVQARSKAICQGQHLNLLSLEARPSSAGAVGRICARQHATRRQAARKDKFPRFRRPLLQP